MKRKQCLPVLLLLLTCLAACRQPANTLFVPVPESVSGIHFANKLPQRELFSILYYLYYYNGGGVATGDINNDGLPDLYFTANDHGKNKLYLNKGNLQFEDITEQAGVAGSSDWCSGVTMADINGDGYLDIYVSSISKAFNLEGRNELFINNGNNTFTEAAVSYGLDFAGYATQAAFFDFDHDGDLDCYLLNQSQKAHENIVDTSKRRKFDPRQGDRFYRNELHNSTDSPMHRFTDISAAAGIYQSSLGYGLGIAVADFNNDGWEDIYIGNDFHENDYYYLNSGKGYFVESGARHFGHYSRFSMGNDAADYDNDGQLDIVTVDMLPPDEKVLKTYGSDENPDVYRQKLEFNGYQLQYSRNCLQRNNGSGQSFSETGLLAGISATDWSWTPLLADFDNDGNKDLFITSGIEKRPVDLDYIMYVSDKITKRALNSTDKYDAEALSKMPDGRSHPFFFKGNGKSTFTSVSDSWGTEAMKGVYNGAAYADLDNDGDLDLIVNALNATSFVLENKSNNKTFLSLSFEGNDGNTRGVGAKLYLFQPGRLQYQQMMPTRGFQSASDDRLHFGLDSTGVDSLLVVWPNQQYQVIHGPLTASTLRLQQKDAGGNFQYSHFFPALPVALETWPENKLSNWTHHENAFTDYNVQYLIPHAQSTRGPKLAVGDVNNDGLDDLYACGATGQPGSLLIQQSNGSFLPSDTAAFNPFAAWEEVDARFFDANGDGYLDLLIVSGGYEFGEGSPALSDRLYLNTGKGHFTTPPAPFPLLLTQKSTIAIADMDADGDQDIFIGVLADSKAYGIPQSSYLLINDGRANFTEAPATTINLAQLGMVTDSRFADINQDGRPDLIVCGEWMPLTIFVNQGGHFEKTTIPHSSGWWQTILIADANADGHPDILAGNWGWNNKFHSGKNGPVKMYVNDFDKNGRSDQLLSYTRNGIEYPFLAKDEIERWMPVLKKHYLLYSEYAGLPMKDAFFGFVENVKPEVAEVLGSAIAFADGKGGYRLQELPEALQQAPIFTFQELEPRQFLAGGNFYATIPYEGRYDGQALRHFSLEGGNLVVIPEQQIDNISSQVRDIKWIRQQSGRIIAVAQNNKGLLFFRHNSN